MPKKTEIDPTPRKCVCGAVFRISDYPPGYFCYKYQVGKLRGADGCVQCAIAGLKEFLELRAQRSVAAYGTPKEQKHYHQVNAREEANIRLLETGEIQNSEQAKNALHIYAGYMSSERRQQLQRLARS